MYNVTITFDVNGQVISHNEKDITLLSDSIDLIKARFNFSPEWQGYTKTAIFKSDTKKPYSRILVDGVCMVPPEAIKKSKYMSVSVFGVSGTQLITATDQIVPLTPSGYTDDSIVSPAPTENIYQQIVTLMQRQAVDAVHAETAQGKAEEARDDAKGYAEQTALDRAATDADRTAVNTALTGFAETTLPDAIQAVEDKADTEIARVGQSGDTQIQAVNVAGAEQIGLATAQADRAEDSASAADAALNKLVNLDVSAETLAPGSNATVSKTETETGYTLAFGVPQGTKGEKGEKGDPGAQGAQGLQGIPGEHGSDAQVTAGNISAALGYTPASDADVADIDARVTNLETYTRNADLTPAQVQAIVTAGEAAKYFAIGDQLTEPWKDTAANVSYDVPWNVAHIGKVDTEAETDLDALYLQWDYAAPFGLQFSQHQAFYCVEGEELPAGTYNVTMGVNWGANVVSGKTYQFTLTLPVPAGGQLSGFRGAPDQAVANWRVYSHASSATAAALETVTVTEGSDGTSLGTFLFAENGALNSLQRTAYGDNSWKRSAMRQWLNSAAGVGAWWTPQSKWDRPPDQLPQKAGFLAGMSADLLAVLAPVKVVTYANTVTDGGAAEITYDRVFLQSLQQMYVVPQIEGEGEAWDYYKQLLGTSVPVAQYSTNPALIKYAIENKTEAQSVRLRSASSGAACYAWLVYASGSVTYDDAARAFRCAPACAIHKKS